MSIHPGVNADMKVTQSEIQRFWERVDKSKDCWIWMGATQSSGHGRLKIGGKAVLAHRVAYFLANGRLPRKRYVCHRCNNASCVNPDHLYAGTPRQNVLDSIRAGTHRPPRFNRSGAKLTEYQVRVIRQRLADGETPIRIAPDYGLDPSTIRKIRDGRSWKNVV